MKFHGTILEYGNAATYAASNSWTAVGALRELDPPAPEAEDIDVTTAESADEAREYEPGLLEGSEVRAKILSSATNGATLQGIVRTAKGFRLKLSGGNAGWKFNGYVKTCREMGEIGGVFEFEIVIKISGKPVRDDDVTA
jgi:hypothetical protein